MYRLLEDKTSEEILLELFEDLLKQAKLTNLYLASMTGEEFTEVELEEDHY